MNPATMTPEQIRTQLETSSERLARVRADKWSHVFEPDGERMIVTRAVMDRDGRKAGDEAPAVLCEFGPEVSWWETEFIRECRSDLAFALDTLALARKIIREQRTQIAAFEAVVAALPSPPPQSGLGGENGQQGRMRGETPNLAAEASIKCTEPAFQRFLTERHAKDDDGDLSDSALAASVLRRALAIGSRKDLNTDPDAASRWRDMRSDFGEWMRG